MKKTSGVKFDLGGAYTDGNAPQRGGDQMADVFVDLEDLLSYEGDGLPSDR